VPEINSHPYQRGFYYSMPPIAPVAEHCRPVAAGPITFVVESRLLTTAILATELPEVELTGDYDDFGATVHVCDNQGVEHLRFDCFEHEPHYHYLLNAEGGQLVCRIDEVANGDPVQWTLERLRHRLSPMLALAGAHQLAGDVEAQQAVVTGAVDQVAELLYRASADANRRRGPAPAG
jgi:hypothetical protein